MGRVETLARADGNRNENHSHSENTNENYSHSHQCDLNENHSHLSGSVSSSPGGGKKTRVRETQADALWSLEPHVCGACFGRLVSQPAPGGGQRYQCTNCGAEARGDTPAVLCSCGLTLRRPSQASRADARIRCQPNPAPTPEFPSVFVAAEART